MLDASGSNAVEGLMTSSRMSWADPATRLGLSASAAAGQARERGAIRGFAAIVDPDAAGLDLPTFVADTLVQLRHRDTFLAWPVRCPDVQECHHLAGDDDQLIEPRCSRTPEPDRVVTDEHKRSPGIARARTSIALSTVKETVALPVAGPPDGV